MLITNPDKTTKEYKYNRCGQLSQEIDPKQQISIYSYDNEGNLIKQEDKEGLTTDYTYDAAKNLTRIQYNNKETVSYTYNQQGQVINIKSKTTYERDLLGRITRDTPIYKINNKGEVTNRMTLDPFGKDKQTYQLQHTQLKLNPELLGFTGYEEDQGTGLMFVQARYYMPELGRFVEIDPNKGSIYTQLSLNYYIHCYNNPLSYVDWDGRAPISTTQTRNSPHGNLQDMLRDTNAWTGHDMTVQKFQGEGNIADYILVTARGSNASGTIQNAVVVLREVSYVDYILSVLEGNYNVFYRGSNGEARVNIHALNRAFGHHDLARYIIVCEDISGDVHNAILASIPSRMVVADAGDLGLLVTQEQWDAFEFTRNTDLVHLDRLLREYGITTPESIAMFMATVRHEAGPNLREREDGGENPEQYFLSQGYNGNASGAGYIQVSVATQLDFLRYIQGKETDPARLEFIRRALAEYDTRGSIATHFPNIDRTTFIGRNYPWEASVWVWARQPYGAGHTLNDYVNTHGTSEQVFRITQYFINGWLDSTNFPHFDSDLRSMRLGTAYTIDHNARWVHPNGRGFTGTITINGRTYRLPISDSDRMLQHSRAINAFGL